MTAAGKERKKIEGKQFGSLKERSKIHGFGKDTMAKAGQENCENFEEVTLQRAYIDCLHPSAWTPAVCCFTCLCFSPI